MTVGSKLRAPQPNKIDKTELRGVPSRNFSTLIIVMVQTEHIVFLLVEEFSRPAFASAVEPWCVANLINGKTLCKVSHASEDGAKTVSSTPQA